MTAGNSSDNKAQQQSHQCNLSIPQQQQQQLQAKLSKEEQLLDNKKLLEHESENRSGNSWKQWLASLIHQPRPVFLYVLWFIMLLFTIHSLAVLKATMALMSATRASDASLSASLFGDDSDDASRSLDWLKQNVELLELHANDALDTQTIVGKTIVIKANNKEEQQNKEAKLEFFVQKPFIDGDNEYLASKILLSDDRVQLEANKFKLLPNLLETLAKHSLKNNTLPYEGNISFELDPQVKSLNADSVLDNVKRVMSPSNSSQGLTIEAQNASLKLSGNSGVSVTALEEIIVKSGTEQQPSGVVEITSVDDEPILLTAKLGILVPSLPVIVIDSEKTNQPPDAKSDDNNNIKNETKQVCVCPKDGKLSSAPLDEHCEPC